MWAAMHCQKQISCPRTQLGAKGLTALKSFRFKSKNSQKQRYTVISVQHRKKNAIWLTTKHSNAYSNKKIIWSELSCTEECYRAHVQHRNSQHKVSFTCIQSRFWSSRGAAAGTSVLIIHDMGIKQAHLKILNTDPRLVPVKCTAAM